MESWKQMTPVGIDYKEARKLPKGVAHAYGFSAFNALSFQVIIGSPMILYAMSLDAPATLLGVIAGMLPLMNLLQIPAARYVGRVGHKRFVIGGWSIRVGFIVLMAAVPLLAPLLGKNGQLAAVLVLLFLFNASRGISVCGWLPWITSIIPQRARGHYLTRESAVANFASLAAFVLAALVLGKNPGGLHFAALFAFSALAGGLSLTFLKRIPEDQNPEELFNSVTPVRLVTMLRQPPFRQLLLLTACWSMGAGGISAFSVVFLRESTAFPGDRILLMNSFAFVGGISTLLLLGFWLDRLGSRPVLIVTALFSTLSMAGWISLASGFFPPSMPIVFLLMFAMGLGASAANLASIRLAMTTVPETGRSHYFAVFSVVGSTALGLSPILCGVVVDFLDQLEPLVVLSQVQSTFAILFAGIGSFFILTFIAALRIHEPESVSLDRLLRQALSRYRLRFWIRLWPRP
jgi:MFS family permease